MLAPKIMGKASPFRNLILWCMLYMYYARTYTHESSTQDAPALRTRGGGLKIFYDRSTLPHTSSATDSCILVYIVLLVTHLWFFRGLGTCKTVVQLRQLLFKGVVVMFKYGMCT